MTIENQSKARIAWIDLLRVVAIIAVLLVHATEGIYQMKLDYMTSISIQSKLYAFTMFAAGRLGVPLFLMISGYLLLDREYNREKAIRFWKNNWLHLFVCTEIWIFGYDLFLKLYANQNISTLQIICDLLFIHKVNMGHVWYMPMILGFYILVPFVSNSLKNIDVSVLHFPLIFFSIYSFGFPLVQLIFTILQGSSPFALQMSLGFSGGTYGIYLLMGFIIKKGAFKQINRFWLVLISALSFAGVVLLMLWSYHMGYAYNVWYDNIFLFISSVTIFELFSRIKTVKMYHAVTWLSKYSFGVYLTHYIVRFLLNIYIRKTSFIQPVKVLIVFLVCGVGGFILAYIIGRIPKVGKWLLYLK